MLENWCWDKKVLKRFSKHVETGEPLPDDLIAAKVRAKTFGNGIHYKRQLFFAMIDQRVHSSEWDASKLDTADLWASMWKNLTHIEPSPGNGMASFGHLMGGYGSRYYGYIYSEVFSADMYSLFEADPFNAALGKRYRDIVLAPGGERDSMDSLVEFLGRPPNNTAFLKSLGLSQ
jgi:Zn-dependent oligopeptidase